MDTWMLLGILFLAVFQLVKPGSIRSKDDKKVMVCYYGSWAVHNKGADKFEAEDIDPFLCTHIIYAFAVLGDDNTIQSLDPCNDLEGNGGNGAFRRFTGLKDENPELKALLAIGGWEEGSEKYSKMASDPREREKFVRSVIQMLNEYNFDGLDFDWEYPALRGGIPEDKANFISILSELKEAFAPFGYLLTAAVGAGKDTIDTAYDIPAMSRLLDHIHVMGYDYHGSWDPYTGHNAPLYANPSIDSGKNAWFNQNYTVNYFMDNGAPPSKIVLGMPLYGQSFTLENETINGLYAPATSGSSHSEAYDGSYHGSFRELCKTLAKEDWTIVRDIYYQAPYAFSGKKWISYDDQESLKAKSEYAVSKGLLGAMVWSIESDDVHGTCFGEPFVLIKTITDTMSGPNKIRKIRRTRSIPAKRPWKEPSKNIRISSTGSSCQGSKKPTTVVENLTDPLISSNDECHLNAHFQNLNNKDCTKFYQCIPIGNQITIFEFRCAAGTAFDLKTNSCNFSYLVKCS